MKKPRKTAKNSENVARYTIGADQELSAWIEAGAARMGIKPPMFARIALFEKMTQEKSDGRK